MHSTVFPKVVRHQGIRLIEEILQIVMRDKIIIVKSFMWQHTNVELRIFYFLEFRNQNYSKRFRPFPLLNTKFSA